MARFSNELLERLKKEVSLVRLVQGFGVALKKQGKDYVGCCPFHDDKTPSLVVSPESNLWNCLGACGKGGSVIDWVMKTRGVSFRHAVELLKSDEAVESSLVAKSAGAERVGKTTVRQLAAPVSANAEDQVLLQQVIEYYHQTLNKSPEALAYLQKRGLDDAELIAHFKLGFSNRTLGLRLPQKNRKAGAEIREQLQRIGIYRESGHEHFNGSLVIPAMDENGVVTDVYGRKLLDTLREGTPKHLYLPGPHQGVFNLAALQHSEEIILCEALIDALTFWRWGFRHVTSSFGVNGFTDDILHALVSNKVKRVLIAYDRDEAGDKAAVEVAAVLNKHGIDCFRILFPKGMDANEFALQVTPAQKSLALAIRKAEWLGSGKAPAISTITEENKVTESHFTSAASVEPVAAREEMAQVGTPEIPIAAPAHPAPAAYSPSMDIKQEKTLNIPATPVPPSPASSAAVQQKDNALFITLGDRVYRVRGLDKNSSPEALKVQLMAKRDEAYHMDKLDLYSSKQRQIFINQASVELGLSDDVLKKDLGKVLLALEEQQAKQQEVKPQNTMVELSSEDRKAALSLLNSPDLLDRILSDFTLAGVVGEETNKLAGYLACISRKCEKPLALIIQSSSAAGKSSLMEAILAFMPEEERVQYSAMTGQSLFYMGTTNLKHKILAISEEEGAHNASYALKLLQSEGEVTIASTGKDEASGNMVTKEYKVEGPVMLFLTTTAIDIDEELLNRCVVLTVNESREQTQAIHHAQRARRTLQGLHNQLERQRIIQLHRNAQRLLKPLAVINPYADQLTFLDDKTRTRRDHEKYLTLIDSIALLHQFQREVKTLVHDGKTLSYIEVTLNDIATANRLAHDILGRTLDELPPQTRKLLKEIQRLVNQQCELQGIEQCHYRFSRKTIRDFTGWSDGQLKIHCRRLEDMEYLLVHKGGRGQSFDYELLYTGDVDTDKAQLMGLLDVQKLQYDTKKSGLNGNKAVPSQGQVSPKSDPQEWLQVTPLKAYSQSGQACAENALQAV